MWVVLTGAVLLLGGLGLLLAMVVGAVPTGLFGALLAYACAFGGLLAVTFAMAQRFGRRR